MADTRIHDVKVTEVPLLSDGGRIVQATRVTMYVGIHGPFTQDFIKPNDGIDAINAWKMQKQQYVQSIEG